MTWILWIFKFILKILRDIGGSSEFGVPLLRELSSFRRFDIMRFCEWVVDYFVFVCC